MSRTGATGPERKEVSGASEPHPQVGQSTWKGAIPSSGAAAGGVSLIAGLIEIESRPGPLNYNST
jgi:hypothetical protein